MAKLPHLLCNQTSHNFEIYTPRPILDSATVVMGHIDLDVASCEAANENVRARRFFTQEQDGLKQHWKGNVWMNHPYGAYEKACPKKRCKKLRCKKRGYHLAEDFPGNAAWVNKLVNHFLCGDIDEAMCITWASTSEDWFKPLKTRFPMCLPDDRTKFVLPDGTLYDSPPKGTAITYLGPNVGAFEAEFRQYGDVVWEFQTAQAHFSITPRSKAA